MSSRYFIDLPPRAGEMELEGPEAHHLLHAMRVEPGEKIVLFHGDGIEAAATILESRKRSVLLLVEAPTAVDRELPFQLHVATAFPKGDRGDFLIEKLTELGVSDLTPINAERSVVQVRDEKRDKLTRQVIEASKQCGRNRLMKIHPAISFKAFVKQTQTAERFLLHPSAQDRTLGYSLPPASGPRKILFCIGPEGGFSDAEVELARGTGWPSISFGERILRTETACIMAAAWATYAVRAIEVA